MGFDSREISGGKSFLIFINFLFFFFFFLSSRVLDRLFSGIGESAFADSLPRTRNVYEGVTGSLAPFWRRPEFPLAVGMSRRWRRRKERPRSKRDTARSRRGREVETRAREALSVRPWPTRTSSGPTVTYLLCDVRAMCSILEPNVSGEEGLARRDVAIFADVYVR